MIGAGGELHVLGHVDQHRAGTAGGRDVERLVQDLGEIVDVAHQPVVLGAGPRDADGVAFLERVVADQVRRHLAGDADQRDRIHQRVGQRRHHVGGAGTGGHQHDAGLAGRARIAFGGMAGALLVADQDVLDLALLEDLVIDRKHRAAGIAEEMLHAVIDQRADDHRGARHLVRIVALVAHWLAPDALVWRGLRWSGLGNKKGPEEAPCAPPEFGWPQPPPAVHLGTTTIRSLVIMLRICPLRLPKGCAKHSHPAPNVKARAIPRDFGRLAGFRAFGESENAAMAQKTSWPLPPRHGRAHRGRQPLS